MSDAPVVAPTRPGKARTARAEPKKPPLYRVVMLNDDTTPFHFVVEVLRRLFQLAPRDAFDLMLRIHHGGRGTAGVYPFEIAEGKVHQVHGLARQFGHELSCELEPETDDGAGD